MSSRMMSGKQKRFLKSVFCGTVLLLVGIAGVAEAQGSNPQTSCNAAILSLSPCVPFLIPPPNNVSITPSQQCCDSLSTVFNTSASCICTLFQPGNPQGIFFNRTQALSLPLACRISAPTTVLQCLSNSASPPQSPVATPVPSQGNSSVTVNPNRGGVRSPNSPTAMNSHPPPPPTKTDASKGARDGYVIHMALLNVLLSLFDVFGML